MRPKLVSLIIFIVIIIGCRPSSPSGSTGNDIPVPEGYELSWAEEFDTNGKPDDQFWTYEEGFVRNRELQFYQPDNANIQDGRLVIAGKREKVENPEYDESSDDWRKNRQHAEYTSACIKTVDQFSFKYGIMEVRARIDTSMGSWPAIWTLGVEKPWPANGEVDVMEFYRQDDEPKILANAAWGSEEGWEAIWDEESIHLDYFLEKDPKWPEKFHIWKMEWTEEHIRLYLDDELLNEIDVDEATYESGFNPFRQPHYILLNLALGSNGGDPASTEFPVYYEVDYVRVFQEKNG